MKNNNESTRNTLSRQVLWCVAGCVGLLLHYGMPQLRKQLPWLCIARPMLRSHEHLQYEVRDAAKIMWFEKVRHAIDKLYKIE